MRMLTKPFATLGRGAAMIAVAVAVLAGGFGLGAGVTSIGAQRAPAAQSEIQGCVNNFTGMLRITGGAGQCTEHERPLSWSQLAPDGLYDVQFVQDSVILGPEDSVKRITLNADCPDGYHAISGGGGLGVKSGVDDWFVSYSAPTNDVDGLANGWRVVMETADGGNSEGQQYNFDVYAVCARSA